MAKIKNIVINFDKIDNMITLKTYFGTIDKK